MRRGLPRPSSLLTKPISSIVSLLLAGLPTISALAEDYRYSNPRQEYRNDYQARNDYSPTTRLDRQIQLQNAALNLRFKPPAPLAFTQVKVDPIKVKAAQPTFTFNFVGTAPQAKPITEVKAAATPQDIGLSRKQTALTAIGNTFKAVGRAIAYPFQKIGQGIVNLVQKTFGGTKRPPPMTDSQRQTMALYANLSPTGNNNFKVTGKQTYALGKVWEEGSTLKLEGDQLRLVEGTTLEKNFAGFERKDGGLLPVRMAEVNGKIQPTGLDLSRMAPQTTLTIKSPINIEGFGQINAGEMTYQGAWQSPDGQLKGGRFSFQNTILDLDKGMAHGLDMSNPVVIKQANFALEAGLMRLNSAVVEKGDRKFFIQANQAPVDAKQLDESVGRLENRAEKGATLLAQVDRDLTNRAEASTALFKNMAKQTGQETTLAFEFKNEFQNLVQESKANKNETQAAKKAIDQEDYGALSPGRISELTPRLDKLDQETSVFVAQADAIRGFQRSLSGMTEGLRDLTSKADFDKLANEKPISDEELNRREHLYFPEEKAKIRYETDKALSAINTLEERGVITPDQRIIIGAQVMIMRDRLLGSGLDPL